MNNNDSLTNELNINHCRLSKSYRALAAYIDQHAERIPSMTAAMLAHEVGISESTVVRFANAFGYDGYPELLKALQYAEKTGLKPRIALTCGSLSETEFALNHYEEAINYIDRAIQLEREEGREAKLRIRLAQKATILAGSGKRQEAVEIFDSIIPYFRTTGNHQSLAISLNKAGQALLEMGNTNEAKQQQAAAYFRESARLCREMDNPYNEMQARRGLYQALWTLNPDSARIELEAFNLLKDSLYNQASAETLARYNAEFGNDQLQQENEEVRRAHRTTIAVGIVIIALIIVGAWFVIRRQRRRQQQGKKFPHFDSSFKKIRCLEISYH